MISENTTHGHVVPNFNFEDHLNTAFKRMIGLQVLCILFFLETDKEAVK